MKSLVLAALLVALPAFGALKLEADRTKAVFLNSSGKQITAIQAVQDSIKGEKVLKCQEVEASASERGNISLKAKR